ncbi:MAG: glycosyltransferase [Bacteroidota bacterium]
MSVLVTAYKHEEYIEECLDSIINQEFENYEILVGVDDGGDNTLNILREIEAKHAEKVRIIVNDPDNVIRVNGKRVGRANFLNILKHAKGQYYARCDGDDYWCDPLKLKKQVDFLDTHTECMVCHHWQKVAIKNEEGNYVEREVARERLTGYFPKRVATLHDYFSYEFKVFTRAVMFRNTIDKFPDWFYEAPMGDFALPMIYGKYGNFGFIDEAMAVHRLSGEGMFSSQLARLGKKEWAHRRLYKTIKLLEDGNKENSYKYTKEVERSISFLYFLNSLRYGFNGKLLVEYISRLNSMDYPLSAFYYGFRRLLSSTLRRVL